MMRDRGVCAGTGWRTGEKCGPLVHVPGWSATPNGARGQTIDFMAALVEHNPYNVGARQERCPVRWGIQIATVTFPCGWWFSRLNRTPGSVHAAVFVAMTSAVVNFPVPPAFSAVLPGGEWV